MCIRDRAATDAKFNISEVEDRKGAISIGCARPINNGPTIFAPPKVFIILLEIAALCWPGIIKMFAFPTISEKGYKSEYSSLRATSGCISPSNLKSTFFSFNISTASLICFVLLVIGWPNVEWDKKVDFKFDGDMQPDVALNEEYTELYPFSEIVGNANILIMPGQHSAAISNKIMKTLGGAKIIGPLLIGLAQPIEIAPLRSSTSEILDLASVAAYSAGVINYKKTK